MSMGGGVLSANEMTSTRRIAESTCKWNVFLCDMQFEAWFLRGAPPPQLIRPGWLTTIYHQPQPALGTFDRSRGADPRNFTHYSEEKKKMIATARSSLERALGKFPWVKAPFIVAAPMRVMSGPDLALAVSKAGGLGFIGPGLKPADTKTDLAKVRELLSSIPAGHVLQSIPLQRSLPVGVGFQLWNGDIAVAAEAVKEYKPCVAWLFAPAEGQPELDEWATRLREASPETQIWIQVGTLREALQSAKSSARPDVLVIQGAEAGGHGRARDGLGIVTLLPEVWDGVQSSRIPLIAAGGIADGRGVAAALALGASGVAMGTRFLASTEARIKKGYQQEVVRATDGAKSTTRTMLYNQLRGTTGWPEPYSPRGIVNKSWYDYQIGVPFDELKKLHDEAEKAGDEGWGPEGRLATYAGAAIGLVNDVKSAGEIVNHVRAEAEAILQGLGKMHSNL